MSEELDTNLTQGANQGLSVAELNAGTEGSQVDISSMLNKAPADSQEPDEDEAAPVVSELKLLKERADVMGIDYTRNANKAKMLELFAEHERKEEEARKLAASQLSTSMGTVVNDTKSISNYDRQQVGKNKAEAHRLIRVQIINNDPSKAAWTGIPITTGNDIIGHISRIIPLNSKEWHLEAILLEHLRGLKYQHFPQKKERNDSFYADPDNASLLPAFTIIELPPLTPAELQDLASRQAQAGTGQTENG